MMENDARLFRKWEVLQGWKIDGRKLAEYVCDGLPAYNRYGALLPTIEDRVISFRCSEEEFLTYLAAQIAWLIIDDVKDFEIVHGITSHFTAPAQQKPTKPPTAKQIAARNAKQIVREAVRTVAKKVWGKTPSITKADMVMHNEINSVAGAVEVSPERLGKWIADLNPNRKPGRRPKKA